MGGIGSGRKEKPYICVPNRVREYRKKIGMSMKELSEASGISYGTLAHVELYNINIYLQQAFKIANALQVTIFDIFPEYHQEKRLNTGVKTDIGRT